MAWRQVEREHRDRREDKRPCAPAQGYKATDPSLEEKDAGWTAPSSFFRSDAWRVIPQSEPSPPSLLSPAMGVSVPNKPCASSSIPAVKKSVLAGPAFGPVRNLR